jgi:NosR/NirI family nitrous oxide reductase transcriptional regulator
MVNAPSAGMLKGNESKGSSGEPGPHRRNVISRYAHWLHTRWPAGTVEPLPEANEDGTTRVAGIRIVGDLTGIPLLKFSADTGARAVQQILKEPDFAGGRGKGDGLDLAIIGGGVAGIAAAMEAKKAGLRFEVFEATQVFSTIVNFPKAKPIYTYPKEMTPAGDMQFRATVKEPLIEELEQQRKAAGIETTQAHVDHVEKRGDGLDVYIEKEGGEKKTVRARRVIIAIGRSGNYRKLGCPGEELDKVYNRLHDPKDYGGKKVLVVGGGDSALETAIALAISGAQVTLSYRKPEFSRPKPDNVEKLEALRQDPTAQVQVEKPSDERASTASTQGNIEGSSGGSIEVALATTVKEIREGEVTLTDTGGKERAIPNDVVFAMIGREPPLDFLRRSGIAIRNEWNPLRILSCVAFVIFCAFIYSWKSDHPHEIPVQQYFQQHKWFPFNPAMQVKAWAGHEGNVLYTIRKGLGGPSFYYTLAYCMAVLIFGIRRMKRRNTPYVKWQTITLIAVQWIPLFILPEIILPWMGRNGFFEKGHPLRTIADALFETYDNGIGHERAYWRAYGFILAWPLNVYNVFTDHPLWTWLVISFVQTFVIIPLIIYRWGKGAYCGWICSCGALAETMGDTHREKMPHGPGWNRLNMLGQATMAFAFVILLFRIVSWMAPNSFAGQWYTTLFEGSYKSSNGQTHHIFPFLNYAWLVDIFFGGILGVGLYFWFSGRMWCRFACPLAALMHIYARFSKYRIFADKKKCISCNVCTSVCHQGIDVMNFANKGKPMEDPECVRCSACVQQCPTGVLSFGRLTVNGKPIFDTLGASPVQMREH